MSTKKQGSGVRDQRSVNYQNPKLKTQNSKLIFVTGGARSGKSAFALNLANRGLSLFTGTPPHSPPWQGGDDRGGRMGTVPGMNRKCYLATAQALDSEMEERIARHKAERGPDWDCIEEPLQVTKKIEELKGRYDVILFDCLTLWLSNLMHARSIPSPLEGFMPGWVEGQGEGGLGKEFDSLISVIKTAGLTVIVVSNEVGLGIVPDNQLARQFRDMAGTVNQLFAKAADEAYFVVSGIPMRLK